MRTTVGLGVGYVVWLAFWGAIWVFTGFVHGPEYLAREFGLWHLAILTVYYGWFSLAYLLPTPDY